MNQEDYRRFFLKIRFLCIISFDAKQHQLCSYTGTKSKLKDAVSSYKGNSDAKCNIYDAIYLALTHTSGKTGYRCIVVFTDGYDKNSKHTLYEISNLAKEKGISIYIAGLSTKVNSSKRDTNRSLIKKCSVSLSGQSIIRISEN